MKGGWKNSWKHRSSLDIMAEILEKAMNGAMKTSIMYKANLSFEELNKYLSFLLEIGLLKNVNKGGKTVYKTTAKGLQYIQGYKKLTALLDSEKVLFQEKRKEEIKQLSVAEEVKMSRE